MTTTYRAFRIHGGTQDGQPVPHRADFEDVPVRPLNEGEVRVLVEYSSINYKDALAGTGSAPILRHYPMNGGIDAAGHVIESNHPNFKEGDAVVSTGCGLSETRDGGYAEQVILDGDQTIALPSGMSAEESMMLGTAGFTAALAVYLMVRNEQTPEQGAIVVTGATGGVGMLAVNILQSAGFDAHAITGKFDRIEFLKELGASQVISRHNLHWGQRPLERGMWAGAIDTVGGEMLDGLTRVIQPYGNIAVCGLAGGQELHSTVMPFIIRGVSMLGVASSGTPIHIRQAVWEKLAWDWKPDKLNSIHQKTVSFDALPEHFDHMLAGQSFGRTTVKM